MPIETPPPKYTTIINALQGRIEAGGYLPGTLLPSEAVLSREFDASRSTVVRALEYLRQGGWVESQQGRGRIVLGVPAAAPSLVPQRLRALLSVSEATAGTLLKVGPTPAAAPVAAALGIPDRATVIARHLLRHGDTGPAELRTVYLPVVLAAGTGLADRQPLREGLLAHLRRRAGTAPDHVVERISARPPTPREATLLEVGPRDCLLAALWTLRDRHNRALLVVEAAFSPRAARWRTRFRCREFAGTRYLTSQAPHAHT